MNNKTIQAVGAGRRKANPLRLSSANPMPVPTAILGETKMKDKDQLRLNKMLNRLAKGKAYLMGEGNEWIPLVKEGENWLSLTPPEAPFMSRKDAFSLLKTTKQGKELVLQIVSEMGDVAL
jgi:hypothetical protein